MSKNILILFSKYSLVFYSLILPQLWEVSRARAKFLLYKGEKKKFSSLRKLSMRLRGELNPGFMSRDFLHTIACPFHLWAPVFVNQVRRFSYT